MKDSDKLKIQIRGWLTRADWTLTEISSPDTPWVLQGSFGGPPTTQFYPMPRQDCLVIRSSFTADEALRQKWAQCDPELRKKLFWDVRFRLVESGAEFTQDQDFAEIVAIDRIYLDGLTQDQFWQRVRVVRNAILGAVWHFLIGIGFEGEITDRFIVN